MATYGRKYADPVTPPVSPPDAAGNPRLNGSVTTSGDESNFDGADPNYRYCTDIIPTTTELFKDLPTEGLVLAGVLSLFTLLTIAIYIEEVFFIRRNFRNPTRTVWVLACYPVFSVTGLLGVFVPKSGTLIDLMANTFFATCLYNFGFLMVGYMGGPRRMWTVIDPERKLRINVPPFGCFCCCVPPLDFKRPLYNRLRILVLQVTVVRPILMFLAVVLWANGSYRPGSFGLRNAFSYMAVVNIASTMSAVYGLMLFKNAFLPELGVRFRLVGKIVSVQLSLLCSIIPNAIIGILVMCDVIKCGPLFPSKARGEAIYHGSLVLLMLPLSLVAQKFFRRAGDGLDCGRELKQNAAWAASLKVVDAKRWLSLGETKV